MLPKLYETKSTDLKINVSKAKGFVFDRENRTVARYINGVKPEQNETYVYLGRMFTKDIEFLKYYSFKRLAK